jgi:hypothetical protein
MRRFSLVLPFVLAFLFAPRAQAVRLGGATVIIPVIGRFPGAGGTQWQTDVFLANAYTPGVTVTLRFYPSGEGVQEHVVTMPQYSQLTLADICLNTFGRVNAGGMLEIVASPPGIVEARARIYNVGNPAGQYGQSAQGINADLLNRQAFLFGLSTSSANRLNIGVANPNSVAVNVSISVRSANTTLLHSRAVTVQPKQFLQMNDIASSFGIAPQDALVVEMNATDPIYGYASEVRNDTGDAVFTFGVSPNG